MDQAFMEAYYAAYNSEDAECLAAFYADNVELVSAQGTQRGKDAMLDTYRGIIAAFRDQMTPESITVDGDSAVVLIRDEFTAKQDVPDFLGMSFSAGDSFTLNLRGTYHAVDSRFTRIEIEQL